MVKYIPLTQGKIAKVDASDYEWLSQWTWHLASSGYARRGASPQVYMHRFIMGAAKGEYVDHVDGDPVNNCRSNLRICTNMENNWNSTRGTNRGKSKYKGVTFCAETGRWRAKIMVGKTLSLGRYNTDLEAALAYDAACRYYHGAFARPNFPGDKALPAEELRRLAIEVRRG